MIHRAKLLHTVWLSLALSLLATPCRATIIVYTITHDTIYVAADGRLTRIDKDGNESYEDGCKIKQLGEIIVAYSGTINDPGTKFDLWEVANSVKADGVNDFATKLKELLRPKLQGSMDFNQRRMKP